VSSLIKTNTTLVKANASIQVANKLLTVGNNLPDLIPYRKGTKWGYCDNIRKIVIDCTYEDADIYRENWVRPYEGLTLNLDSIPDFSIEGKTPKWDKNRRYINMLTAIVKINSQWICIDNKGNRIPNENILGNLENYLSEYWEVWTSAECLNEFDTGIKAVQLNSKWGFVSDEYEQWTPIPVERDGRWTYTGVLGNSFKSIPCIYEEVSSYTEGIASVKLAGKWKLIDKNNIQISSEAFDSSVYFKFGLGLTTLSGKFGFIDKMGKSIIPFIYDNAYEFVDGIHSEVTINDKHGFINRFNVMVVPCIYDGFISPKFVNGLNIVVSNKSSSTPFDKVIYHEYYAPHFDCCYKVGYIDKNGAQYWED